MEYKEIKSHRELIENIKELEKVYVLLYKKGSGLSECARNNIIEAVKENNKIKLYKVNVSEVRDVHNKYSVTSVPALLDFEKNELKNVIKGCHDTVYYKSIFENLVYERENGSKKPARNVIVYSSSTCSWCNTLKAYLRKNGIRFRDVDISRDPDKANELVRRSGQQGVPQTEIDGQIIVGFDKTRINQLLEIQG
jgi:glutaredoxin-like YruB-family protein